MYTTLYVVSHVSIRTGTCALVAVLLLVKTALTKKKESNSLSRSVDPLRLVFNTAALEVSTIDLYPY